MNPLNEEAYVKFADYGPEWIVYSDLKKPPATQKRRSPVKRKAPEYRNGDIVEALYEDEWNDARVLRVDRNEVEIVWVEFDEDPPEWIPLKDVRPKKAVKYI